jgi:PHD/YefM family antitoxin component YafN of YafNO toxin-antitoxin module
MEGIRFVIDSKGKKSAVLIDLKKYSELWEDFYDSLIARLRTNEPRESHKSVKERLRRQGKLRG